MAYSGTAGLSTVFPTARTPARSSRPRAPTTKSRTSARSVATARSTGRATARSKPPCKYGPRVDGYCPKKPPRLTEASTGAIGTASSSSRKSSRAPLGERVIVESAKEAAQTAVQRAIPRTRLTRKQLATQTRVVIGEAKKTVGKSVAKAIELGKTPVKALAGAGAVSAGATGAALAAAGILSYWVTKKILEIPANRRAARSAKAAAAADAYRQARLDLAARQGKPLSQAQLVELATAFKAELAKLGLTTKDLGGL